MNFETKHRDVEHFDVRTNGVRLHVAAAGPEDGPLVVLLHGFPEFWYAWRRYLPRLAAAGYRVWAPDQRGYNTSDKPARVSDYRLDVLAKDVVGLIDAAGRDRAAVFGHDWGAAVTWWTAMRHPARVRCAMPINTPHPIAMRSYLLRHPSQLKKSWYMFAFQLPWLPERALTRDGGKLMFERMRRSGAPHAFEDEDGPVYAGAWAKPGAATAMVNYYRAAFRGPAAFGAEAPEVTVPLRLVWGVKDNFLERGLATASLPHAPHGQLIEVPEAGHWVNHEEVETVSRAMLELLAAA